MTEKKRGRPRKNPLEKEKTKVEGAVERIEKGIKSPVSKKLVVSGNFPTGADLIDLVLGGGYPYGFSNIVGDSSSGKSFLAGEAIASTFHKIFPDAIDPEGNLDKKKVNKNKFDWFYDDAETGYRFNSEKLYKFNILNYGFFKQEKRSNTIEDFERNIYKIIETKRPSTKFIYVLDSFDSITSDDEIAFKEKKLKSAAEAKGKDKKAKGSYNLAKQKEGHAFFRSFIRKLQENRISLIIVSQVRENIGFSFGKTYYRTGGKALDFYANVIFWLAEIEKYYKKDRAVGICTKVQARKSRNDKPFRECLLDLVFDYGIDSVASNINFLFDLKTKDRGRDKEKLICEWDGEDFERAKLIDHIEKSNFEPELARRTIEKWNDIEKKISSDGRKRRF